MRRQLKHYETYIKLIRSYAKGIHLKIEFVDGDNGVFSAQLRRIRCGTEQDETAIVATLLHELGHALDDALVNRKTFRAMSKAYIALEHKKANAKQRRAIVKTEQRAWAYGKIIAKILCIPLGKWYDTYSRRYIREYKGL